MSKTHTYILGINAYDHDVSACLLRDGEIAFAIGKERITREKHDTGFYKEVIDYCLQAEGISLDDVDLMVRNCYVMPVEEIEERLTHQDEPHFLDGKERKQVKSIPLYLSNSSKVLTISHHLAHAYSAFAVCPFTEGVVMVVDGVGSYSSDVPEEQALADNVHPLARESESYYTFEGSKLQLLKKVWMGPSRGFLSDEFYTMPGLGAMYSRASTYVFGDWNKCGELMGLAPYGRPGKMKPLLQLSDVAICMFPNGPRSLRSHGWSRAGNPGKKAPPCRIGRTWHGASRMTRSGCCCTRARWLRETTGAKNLCLAGGVALNCVANGKIAREAGFENVWIQPAAGDDGIAIGCAYYGSSGNSEETAFVRNEPRLSGREVQRRGYHKATSKGLARTGTKRTVSNNICAETAKVLAEGKVIGWFQGRSEFGPRALGNRSIIADPRTPEMKDILNSRVKHRQPFRPFAPIVLYERAQGNFRRRRRFPLHADRKTRTSGMAG